MINIFDILIIQMRFVNRSDRFCGIYSPLRYIFTSIATHGFLGRVSVGRPIKRRNLVLLLTWFYCYTKIDKAQVSAHLVILSEAHSAESKDPVVENDGCRSLKSASRNLQGTVPFVLPGQELIRKERGRTHPRTAFRMIDNGRFLPPNPNYAALPPSTRRPVPSPIPLETKAHAPRAVRAARGAITQVSARLYRGIDARIAAVQHEPIFF